LITHFGTCGRNCITKFQNRFYSKYAINARVDNELFDQHLGKSLSAFVYNRVGINRLFVFDADDGSGGTATDCKISWPVYNNVCKKYDIKDVIFLKLQCAEEPEYHQFFPFKHAIPVGLMTDDPEATLSLWNSLPEGEEDIDVLFIGGRVHDSNTPYCWPTHRTNDAFWPNVRKNGYNKLLDIRDRRKDINIVCLDGKLTENEYYSLVKRSKICLDLPGTARSSRKFYEFIMFGKCVISLPQQTSIVGWRENLHYSSLGWDFQFSNLESRIDELLKDKSAISFFQRSAASLASSMTHASLVDRLMQEVDNISTGVSPLPVYNTLLRP